MIRVNLIAWDNGVGLSSDLRILQQRLTACGYAVHISVLPRGALRKIFAPLLRRVRTKWKRLRGHAIEAFEINLFLEHVRPEYFPLARRQVLIPNPEWFSAADKSALKSLDAVFVKTHHAEAIFTARGCRTHYIGFTSADRYDPTVGRERTFFHLAGRSENKNTEPLLALWRAHPQWPHLTVIQNPRSAIAATPVANITHRIEYIADAELRVVQNAHQFHLCPSEIEGFGHYLVEAMSVAAVTLTLDAAPMNEFIAADRGVLVPIIRTGVQSLSATNFFAQADMAAAIERICNMSDAEISDLGHAARDWYEKNDAALADRLDRAIAAIAAS